MPQDADPTADLAGLDPDPRLLADDAGALPEALGRPVVLPPSRTGRQMVALGATLTGTTLLLGGGLLVLGAALVATGSGVAGVAVLLIGGLLVGTHWGWVHVAELLSQRLERREHRPIVERRERWLGGIEPYARTTITTRAAADGSLELITVRHEPLRAGPTTFTFRRREVAIERHGPDEPAAAIAGRAEALRAAAAAETERAREAWAVAAGGRELEALRAADEAERQAADRAAAEALADRINAHLRAPPVE